MLLEFSFANFLSFRDKVTISMVATALRDRKADIGDATFGIGIFQMVYYEFLEGCAGRRRDSCQELCPVKRFCSRA